MNSPTPETYSVSPPSLANANRKAWEAISNQLFISGLILEKNNNYILYQVAKSVAYLATGKGMYHSCYGGKGTSVARAEGGFFFCL